MHDLNQIIAYFESNSDLFEVFPLSIWPRRKFKEASDEILKIAFHESSKYQIFIIIHDSVMDLEYHENQIGLRVSLLKSKKADNEYVMPYIWDPLPTFDPLPPTRKPRIGYCGRKHKYRNATLRYFRWNWRFKTDYIIRKEYWGGMPNNQDLRKDFEENMRRNHFNICNRGRGNFSMRFYQTLSAGRIPALIVNDFEFPFENQIDWDKYVVTGKDNKELAANIGRVYKERDIIEMQKDCARLYKEFFTPETFAAKMLQVLTDRYSENNHKVI